MRLVVIFIAACAVLLGFLLARAPVRAIDIQKKFYALINWRMEPIDMPKEIRNTRLMGIFLIACVISILFYVSFR